MKKARENQLTYLFLAIIMIPLSVYINFSPIANGEFPNGIMLLALGTNALLMAYLSPHLFPKDERSKEIIGKSMSANYYVLFGTILILFLLVGSFGQVTMTATQTLIVLFSIMTIAIPLTMVVYSKLV